MAREILRTIPLTDLVWSGNDKKTANVPAGDDFEFYPSSLPTFTEQYNKPEEFTIYYRDEFSVMQPLTCNYVSNGSTRYTFSYKLDNDVVNLSVFKSDGHLEINVRPDKLDIPMNLNQVEFQVYYTKSFDAPDYWVEPQEAGTITGPDVVHEGEEVVVEVLINEGYQIIEATYFVAERDGYTWEGELEKIDDTHYSFTMPSDSTYPFVEVNVGISCEEIPVVVEYPTQVSIEPEEGATVNIPETVVKGETYTWTVNVAEGYRLVDLYVTDLVEIWIEGQVVDGNTITFTCPELPLEEGNDPGLILWVFLEKPEPPVPTEGDLIFTTTFNRYAIVDVLVKEDGSAGVVNVRRLTDDDVDLDYTYETVLRAACTFRQDLIVGVEVEMNKPDNVAANYTVKSTKIFINGEEI